MKTPKMIPVLALMTMLAGCSDGIQRDEPIGFPVTLGGDWDSDDSDEGDDSDDSQTEEDRNGPACAEPRPEGDVVISLLGAGLTPDDCRELEFDAKVDVASVGIYGLLTCACDDPVCAGDKLELELTQPDPNWMPDLVPGTCHHFHVFAERTGPGVCRRNRLDIATREREPAWYSTGSAREDLDHNGLMLTPRPSVACDEGCGTWHRRAVAVTIENGGATATLDWGEVAQIGDYEVVDWWSYRSPDGCGVGNGEAAALRPKMSW